MQGKNKPLPLQFAAVTGGAALLAGLFLASKAAVSKLRSEAFDLAGKTIAITGGSRGLGLAMTREFLRHGARVAVLARDKEELNRVQALLSEHKRVLVVNCDVTDQNQVTTAFKAVYRKFGAIDVLVNNAGLIAVGPMDCMNLEDYRESLALHFWGPLYTTLAVLPEMRRRRQGRIVNISSIGGKISVPHLLPYSVGKFALSGFSEGLRTELAKDNILVTSVYPGLMRTGSPRNATFKGKHRSEYAWFSISDSLPGVSIDADRAARQIVSACCRGLSQLIISTPAKAAIKLHQLFPRTSASVLTTVKRMLPSAGGIGTSGRKGRESSSPLSPSWLTVLDELAARKNNEIAV